MTTAPDSIGSGQTVNGLINHAKSQLFRGEMIAAMRRATELLEFARARNSLNMTGGYHSHKIWQGLEKAIAAINTANALAEKVSSEYKEVP